jgi:Protein of unknown function (DUF3237)
VKDPGDAPADAGNATDLTRRMMLSLASASLFGSALARAASDNLALPHPEFTPTLTWEFTARIAWSNGRNATGVYASGQRIYNTVAGGEFGGPRVRGTVLPGGGDWATMNPPDAALDKPVPGRQVLFDARYILRTDDGVHIYVYNRGGKFTASGNPTDAQPHPAFGLSTPMFDVPLESRYTFLARDVFVGLSLARPAETIMQVFRVVA